MSCCGNKRAAQTANAAYARAQKSLYAPEVPRVETQASLESAGSLLKYLGQGTFSLLGPRTGQVYYFASAGPATAIHPNDSEALLRTGLFRRANAR